LFQRIKLFLLIAFWVIKFVSTFAWREHSAKSRTLILRPAQVMANCLGQGIMDQYTAHIINAVRRCEQFPPQLTRDRALEALVVSSAGDVCSGEQCW
jgi:hypothetical protein